MPHANADPALYVGFFAIFLLFCYACWAFNRWLCNGPSTPEPWDEQVAAEIAKDETPPLCHQCLAPHDPLINFCPDCGAPVGTYTNWLPYPYLFSIGHALRTGTSGNFKRCPLTIIGFFLFSLVEYAVFAPLYWFLFFGNLSRQRQSDRACEPHPPVNSA